MLWSQKWVNQFTRSANPVTFRSVDHQTLSHGFSERPYMKNSRFHADNFQPSDFNNYSSELWHYGVPNMHWGVITKEYEKKGYGNRAAPSVSIQKSSLKDSKAKIAKLENIKKQMQQKRKKIIRYGNKVITIMPKHKTKEERRKRNERIIGNGAAKINHILTKAEAFDQKYINKSSDPTFLERLLKKKA